MPTIDAFIIDKLRRRPRDERGPGAELPLELPINDPDRDGPPPEGRGPEEPRPRGVVVLDP